MLSDKIFRFRFTHEVQPKWALHDRLIKFAKSKRVLFLMDRATMGRSAHRCVTVEDAMEGRSCR